MLRFKNATGSTTEGGQYYSYDMEEVVPPSTLRLMQNKRERSEQSVGTFSGDEFSYQEMDRGRKKRSRLNQTPGEIRLRKDVELLENVQNASFEFCDGEGLQGLVISFYADDSSGYDRYGQMTGSCPNQFLLQVRRFYPHDQPFIRCLDPGFACNYIAVDGVITHEMMTDNWSAINGLADIIHCLHNIREMWRVNDQSLFALPPHQLRPMQYPSPEKTLLSSLSSPAAATGAETKKKQSVGRQFYGQIQHKDCKDQDVLDCNGETVGHPTELGPAYGRFGAFSSLSELVYAEQDGSRASSAHTEGAICADDDALSGEHFCDQCENSEGMETTESSDFSH